VSYKIKLVVEGPEGPPDDRGYSRRETLTEIEHVAPGDVASEAVAAVMKILGEAMKGQELKT